MITRRMSSTASGVIMASEEFGFGRSRSYHRGSASEGLHPFVREASAPEPAAFQSAGGNYHSGDSGGVLQRLPKSPPVNGSPDSALQQSSRTTTSPVSSIVGGVAKPTFEESPRDISSKTQHLIFNASLEELLAEQRINIDRALAFNDMISVHLTTERFSNLHESTSEQEAKDKQIDKRSAIKGLSRKAFAASMLSEPPPKSTAEEEVQQEVKQESKQEATQEAKQDMKQEMKQEAKQEVKQELHRRKTYRRRMSARMPVPGDYTDASEPLLAALQEAQGPQRTLSPRDFTKADASRRGPDMQSEDMTNMSWHLFPTLDGVKELVSQSLRQSDDEEIFKTTGCWSMIARNSVFNNTCLSVIILNTLWISYDTDYNQADVLAEADWQFKLADNIFCSVFTFEIVVRFMAYKNKLLAITDYWFLFESFLVALMVWETWVSSILYVFGMSPAAGGVGAGSVLRIFRIFRLLRVARTARLLGSVPELMILAKGMFVAMRSVMVILSLLGLIIYIFSIIFTQLLRDSPVNEESDNHFSSVLASANWLLLQVLCGFDIDLADRLYRKNFICYVLFLLYLLLGSLTLMNMLIGILCDVVFTVANDHKEETFQKEMEFKVDSLAHSLDVNQRGCVAKQDFELTITKPEVILSLNDLGVDVAGLMDFAHFVFQENEELSYTNFEHMVVQFRGGKPATVKDVMDMRKQVSGQLSTILEAYEANNAFVLYVQDRLDKLSYRYDILESFAGLDKTANKDGSTLQTKKTEPIQMIKGGALLDRAPSPSKSNKVAEPSSSRLSSPPSSFSSPVPTPRKASDRNSFSPSFIDRFISPSPSSQSLTRELQSGPASRTELPSRRSQADGSSPERTSVERSSAEKSLADRSASASSLTPLGNVPESSAEKSSAERSASASSLTPFGNVREKKAALERSSASAQSQRTLSPTSPPTNAKETNAAAKLFAANFAE